MTKADIVEEIASKTGLTRKETAEVVAHFIAAVKGASKRVITLKSGDSARSR